MLQDLGSVYPEASDEFVSLKERGGLLSRSGRGILEVNKHQSGTTENGSAVLDARLSVIIRERRVEEGPAFECQA